MNIFKKTKELDEAIEEIYNPTPETEPEEEWIWVEGFKGTDKNMFCRDYQYEFDNQHDIPEDKEIIPCQYGLHLCLSLNLGKEIHAYQNDDGTYNVEMLGVELTNLEDMGIKESKIKIPRAKIDIIGFPSDQNEYFTITIE